MNYKNFRLRNREFGMRNIAFGLVLSGRYGVVLFLCLFLMPGKVGALNILPENPDNQGITATYQTPDCSNQSWTKTNDAQLWHETYWLDKNFSKHDLCEQPVDLSIQLSDNCTGLQVSCLLFLDLDGNDTLETVLNSEALGAAGLGWNQIRYNNLNTPNYAGGTLRAFDERPVPASQKFGFALEETPNGNGITAGLRFNTEATPGTYYPLQLPLGKYKIVWTVSDSCGNNEFYTYEFRVKDCQAPVVNCISNLLSVNIMPTGMITLWASDFLQSTYDNCTPDGNINIGVRKCGTGTGFPLNGSGVPLTSVSFNCGELGLQCVELWAIDFSGNAGFCQVSIVIQDNFYNCSEPPMDYFKGSVKTPLSDGIIEANVVADCSVNFLPPYLFTSSDLTDQNGDYTIGNLPTPNTVVLRAEKGDNVLNGVTTYDLVLISKHILGIQPFDSPFKMIAADVNRSGSVTTFDIVELRKLILGISAQFANNLSWRFIDKAFVFPNPNNPFQTAYPEMIIRDNINDLLTGLDFTGIKIGDVNYSATPNAASPPKDRYTGTTGFDLSDREVQAGVEYDVRFTAAEALEGFQFTLLLNGLKVVQVIESEQVGAENFNLTLENALAVSINGAQEFTLRFKAEKAGRLSEMLRIGDGITRAEAYGKNGLMEPVLRFDGNMVQNRKFELFPNQPNPFTSQTTLSFYLPEAGATTLSVYDATGRLIHRRQEVFTSGTHTITLNDLQCAPGVCYCELQWGREVAVRKLLKD